MVGRGLGALALLAAVGGAFAVYYNVAPELKLSFFGLGNGEGEDEDEDEEEDSESVGCAYLSMIGNTPMLELKKISKLLQCKILVKLECNNPGGTGKDRAAKYMIRKAMRDPRYRRGCDVVEGTSGSTGIALAGLCRAQGLNLHVVMPDDQASEKQLLLESLGVKVRIVPTCAISNRDHYVNSAKRLADELGGIFFDQFENLANFEAHYKETGPEIWAQTKGAIDAFVMSAGTGGTIAGVSQYLKERKGNMVRIMLADPQGSSLLRKVTHGVCFTQEQSERRIKKHRYDSIVEGVGLDRITANFDRAKIDTATAVTDQEVVLMAHWLLQNEGLFVGSSSALNIAAACQTAKELGPGHTIVTIVCDQGQRHTSRFWNKDYLSNYNLVWPAPGSLPACLMEDSLPLSTTIGAQVPPTPDTKSTRGGEIQSPSTPSAAAVQQTEEDDGELGHEFEHLLVKDEAGSECAPAPPQLQAPPPEALVPPLPSLPVSESSNTNTMDVATPKKQPLIRPASRTTPAHAPAAASAPSTAHLGSVSGFADDGGAGGDVEAARILDLKAKMAAKKEQQRLKRALTPQKGAPPA